MSSYRDIPSKSEPDLQAAVATIGPISVAIDASKLSFQVFLIATSVNIAIASYLIFSMLSMQKKSW